jgi:hypothetical protein
MYKKEQQARAVERSSARDDVTINRPTPMTMMHHHFSHRVSCCSFLLGWLYVWQYRIMPMTAVMQQ